MSITTQMKSPPCPGCSSAGAERVVDVARGGEPASSWYHCRDCGTRWPDSPAPRPAFLSRRPLLVLAGSNDQFHAWRKARGFLFGEVVRVTHPGQFFGTDGAIVVLTGTYRDLPAWEKLQRAMEGHNAIVHHDPI